MNNVLNFYNVRDEIDVIEDFTDNDLLQSMCKWYGHNVYSNNYTKTDEPGKVNWETVPYTGKKVYGEQILSNAFARMFVDRIRSKDVDLMCDIIHLLWEREETALPGHIQTQVFNFKRKAQDPTYFTPMRNQVNHNASAKKQRFEIAMTFIDAFFTWRT